MRSFSEAIDQELENINDTSYYSDKRSYVKRGIYHTQIEEYLKYFDRKQLLIIESNSLLFKFDQTLESTLEFIELPYEKLNLIMANKQQINEKVKYKSDIEKLRAFYKPYNEKLFELLGEEYDWND